MGVTKRKNQKKVKKEKKFVGLFFLFCFFFYSHKDILKGDMQFTPDTQVLISPQSIRDTSAFLQYVASVNILM